MTEQTSLITILCLFVTVLASFENNRIANLFGSSNVKDFKWTAERLEHLENVLTGMLMGVCHAWNIQDSVVSRSRLNKHHRPKPSTMLECINTNRVQLTWHKPNFVVDNKQKRLLFISPKSGSLSISFAPELVRRLKSWTRTACTVAAINHAW